MKIARRYRILQRIVWAQSAFSILLSLYVLVSHKKVYPLNVSVNETPAIDFSFLDMVTNSSFRIDTSAVPSHGAPVASGAGTAPADRARRFPFLFDHFSVVSGVPCAVVGKWVYRAGDKINGCVIDSVSALGVVVDGEFYTYASRNNPPKEVDS